MGQYKGIAAPKSLKGLKMYQDNVLVLMDYIRDARKEERTVGGIITPQTAKKPKRAEAVYATVVLAGPGAHITEYSDHAGSKRAESSVFHECPVKAGDRVLVDAANAGQPVPIDGLEHRIIRQHNVIGVVEEDDWHPPLCEDFENCRHCAPVAKGQRNQDERAAE